MVFKVIPKQFEKFKLFRELADNGTIATEAFTKSGLTEGVKDYIEGLGVASAAQMTFSQKSKLVTIALKEQAIAWAASPFGMATIAVAGIFLVVKAMQYFSEAADRAREKLVELKNEHSEGVEQLQDLESELQGVLDRLNELEGKKLTITEKEELANLQAQNRELERQIALPLQVKK